MTTMAAAAAAATATASGTSGRSNAGFRGGERGAKGRTLERKRREERRGGRGKDRKRKSETDRERNEHEETGISTRRVRWNEGAGRPYELLHTYIYARYVHTCLEICTRENRPGRGGDDATRDLMPVWNNNRRDSRRKGPARKARALRDPFRRLPRRAGIAFGLNSISTNCTFSIS